MSTITKDYIIDILNNGSNQNSVIDVIKDYCIEEHGKSINDTMLFLQIMVMKHPETLINCYNHAMSYYQNKFNISLLINNNKIIKAF